MNAVVPGPARPRRRWAVWVLRLAAAAGILLWVRAFLAGPAPLPPDAPQPPPGEAAEPDAPGYAMPEALERELLRVGPMHLAKGALPRSCAP